MNENGGDEKVRGGKTTSGLAKSGVRLPLGPISGEIGYVPIGTTNLES